MLLGFLFYLFLKSYPLLAGDGPRRIPVMDFTVYWAAARLALEGQPLTVFDPKAVADAAGYGGDGVLHWFYPPAFLLLILPLGLLPFAPAWVLFGLISLVALSIALRAPARPICGGWRIFVASPTVIIASLALGQNSALWCACLAGALWSLRSGRPRSAGALIGLLSIKPHLGVLFPLVLLARREWRAFQWATLITLALALIPTAFFGADYWWAFLGGLRRGFEGLNGSLFPVERMSSAYAALRSLGFSEGTALQAQLALSLAVAAALARLWSRRDASDDLRFAALAAAIPLAVPYVFYYDLVTLVIAALFLARHGIGAHPVGRVWLAVLWIGPVAPLYLPLLVREPPAFLGVAVVSAAMSLVSFLAALHLGSRSPRARRIAPRNGREARG